MRRIARSLTFVFLLLVVTAGVAVWIHTEAAPDRTTKTVELWCKNGWKGSAAGVYGGVSFGISCAFDRQSVTLEGVAGTDYALRMGVQSLSTSVDCAFSGSADHVRESCAEVKFIVR